MRPPRRTSRRLRGTVDVAYSRTLAATGGVTPYSWAVVSGSLPAGLGLNASTGEISGTPTTPGTANFTVEVSDSDSPASTDQQALSITISDAGPLDLISPNGGEVWEPGTTHEITWNTTIGGTLKISLYRGLFFDDVIAWETPNDGSYEWAIPAMTPYGKDYRVVLISRTEQGVYDYSESPFEIGIPEPYIDVRSPAADETWLAGTTHTIEWRSNRDTPVDISLYKGGVFDSTIVLGTANDGAFDWTLPTGQAGGSDYTVRISLSDDPSVEGESGVFGIMAESFLDVTCPDGGEVWTPGTIQEITWDSTGAGNVKISLYKGGSFHSLIVADTPNDGSYMWSIPADQEEGDNYRVVIISRAVAGLYDYSENPFTIGGVIKYVDLTAPNGGESWKVGTTHSVTWNSNAGGNVDISLYKGGAFQGVIAAGTANDGTYSWTVPSDQTVGSDYRVRIALTGDATVTDESDADFSITAETLYITVTAPNGGEIWPPGTRQEITWESNAGGSVKINLYRGGFYYDTITWDTPNSGSFSWWVPAGEDGSNYRVVIICRDVSGVHDYSDGPFTIGPAP